MGENCFELELGKVLLDKMHKAQAVTEKNSKVELNQNNKQLSFKNIVKKIKR